MECRAPRAFAMLCAAMFFIYSDQNLMAPNLTAIGHFFGYSDDERDAKLGGQISVAFFLLGLPAALMIGVLCDVVERKRVLVWTLIIGQGPCLLTVFVTEFWQLFILFLCLVVGVFLLFSFFPFFLHSTSKCSVQS